MFAQASRSGGDWGADECPASYKPIVDAAACEQAIYALGVPDTTIDVVADVDGAPRGCLVFGSSPVFAEGDAENGDRCVGCTVVCEHIYRAECEAWVPSARTCADVDGDGIAGDSFICRRGVLKQPVPASACGSSFCTDRDCCDTDIDRACDSALYAPAGNAGYKWGADECPAHYQTITDAAVCQTAAQAAGMAPATVSAAAGAEGVPGGCVFSRATTCSGAALHHSAAASSTTCDGCLVICEGCVVDRNSTTCADINGDRVGDDPYLCPDGSVDFILDERDAPRQCASGVCDAADCCPPVRVALECTAPYYAPSSRGGGNCLADECPHGYTAIADAVECSRAAYALSLSDVTLDVTGDVDGAPGVQCIRESMP
jgi:hypothetical protein